MSTLAAFVPRMELYSIDEAFLDMSQLKYSKLDKLASHIKQTIKQHTGIPVTVGIAPTKTLAKLANRYAKKKKKDGVHCLADNQSMQEGLENTAIEDVWGIGSQRAALLRRNNVSTAADFIKLPDDWVRSEMTVVGLRLLNELRGIPSIEWEFETPAKKNICSSRSFGKIVTEKKFLQEACSNYAATCAFKLRAQNSCARRIEVLVRTNQFRKEDVQYNPSIVVQLPVATNDTTELIKYALIGLDIIFKTNINYHKVGVVVLDLVPNTEVQASLFDVKDIKLNNKIMATMDKINKSFGKDIVRISRQGYEKSWKLRAAHLSPCYTTRIDQLFVLKK
jgi:DNA polymerase V